MNIAYNTVRTWIQRVLAYGVKESLKDKPGGGKPRKIPEESRVRLIKTVASTTPPHPLMRSRKGLAR